jgi:methylated-DNA-[protein]-cysteine S-methyltransferase
MMPVLRYTTVPTTVGDLWVAYGDDGIAMTMLAPDETAFATACAERFGVRPLRDPDPPSAIVDAVRRRLEANTEVPWNLAGCTPFQRDVLQAVAAIPKGETRTYGQIAEAVGRPRAARAVGEVMRTNPIPVLIPCHRVVRSGGDIGRYTPDPAIKRRLLELEGAIAPTP